MAEATSAPGQPALRPPERTQPTRFKCLLHSATPVTTEKTFQRGKGTIAVRSTRLTKARKGMSGCWVERRGGARPRTPQTRFLSNSETSPAPALRPGPRRGQTAESWTEWTWEGVPASQVPGGSPGLMPAPPPTGRAVSGKPRDPEATPVPETPELVRPDPAGLTSLSSEGSAASVCAIRVRSVLLLVQREHPAAPETKAPVGWAPPCSPAPVAPPPVAPPL